MSEFSTTGKRKTREADEDWTSDPGASDNSDYQEERLPGHDETDGYRQGSGQVRGQLTAEATRSGRETAKGNAKRRRVDSDLGSGRRGRGDSPQGDEEDDIEAEEIDRMGDGGDEDEDRFGEEDEDIDNYDLVSNGSLGEEDEEEVEGMAEGEEEEEGEGGRGRMSQDTPSEGEGAHGLEDHSGYSGYGNRSFALYPSHSTPPTQPVRPLPSTKPPPPPAEDDDDDLIILDDTPPSKPSQPVSRPPQPIQLPPQSQPTSIPISKESFPPTASSSTRMEVDENKMIPSQGPQTQGHSQQQQQQTDQQPSTLSSTSTSTPSSTATAPPAPRGQLHRRELVASAGEYAEPKTTLTQQEMVLRACKLEAQVR